MARALEGARATARISRRLVEREVPRFRDGSTSSTGAASCRLMAASMALAALAGCGPEPDRAPAPALCRAAAGAWCRRCRALRDGVHRCAAMPTGVLLQASDGTPDQGRGQSRPSGQPRRGQRHHAGEYPDPLRSASRAVDRGNGQLQSWDLRRRAATRAGRCWRPAASGLRLLTGSVTSPTLAAQIADLQQQFPAMRWHPLGAARPRRRNAAPTQAAFGRAVDRVLRSRRRPK